MLSNRDLSKTTIKNNWLLLIIITVLFIAVTSEAKNQTNNLKNSSTEIEVERSSSELDDSSTELEIKEKPYTSIWSLMYDWWNWMIGGYAQNKNSVGEPRTFGAIRRLQLALIPLVFKFGIIFAMVTALVFLAMKTVFLLKLLVVMNAAAIFAKLLLYKTEHHYQPPPPPSFPWAAYGGWIPPPPPVSSWPGQSPLNKEVHLHIHGSNLAHQPWERSDYGNGYNVNGVTNELNNQGPLPYLRSAQTQTQPNDYSYYGNGGSG